MDTETYTQLVQCTEKQQLILAPSLQLVFDKNCQCLRDHKILFVEEFPFMLFTCQEGEHWTVIAMVAFAVSKRTESINSMHIFFLVFLSFYLSVICCILFGNSHSFFQKSLFKEKFKLRPVGRDLIVHIMHPCTSLLSRWYPSEYT